MAPQLVDQLCLWFAMLVPIPLIVAFRWVGVAIGTVVVWGSPVVAGELLSHLDPQREAALLDHVWLLLGWIGGLLYCLPIMGIRELVAWAIRRRHGQVARPT